MGEDNVSHCSQVIYIHTDNLSFVRSDDVRSMFLRSGVESVRVILRVSLLTLVLQCLVFRGVAQFCRQMCYYFCRERGAAAYGVQFGDECRCSDSLGDYDRNGPGTCDYACVGDKEAICGGCECGCAAERENLGNSPEPPVRLHVPINCFREDFSVLPIMVPGDMCMSSAR